MFGGGRGHVSKRTGADKRTSNFPFSNAESAREKKKAERKEEKDSGKEEKKSGRRSMARTKSSRD